MNLLKISLLSFKRHIFIKIIAPLPQRNYMPYFFLQRLIHFCWFRQRSFALFKPDSIDATALIYWSTAGFQMDVKVVTILIKVSLEALLT